MLDPSSSEEESDQEMVRLPPTVASNRRFVEEDCVSQRSNAYSQNFNDLQSLSAVSRNSGSSTDNVSVTGPGSGVSSGQLVYHGSGQTSFAGRSASPSPSLVSSDRGDTASVIIRDTDIDRSLREEEERRRRVQLYVFLIRCIAYPFNAKQPTDMVRRQVKVTKQQLQTVKERFQVKPLDHFSIFRLTAVSGYFMFLHAKYLSVYI